MSVFSKNDNISSFEKRKRDCKIWFLYFLSFCFIGWLYEVLVFKFELGYGFVNRGFLFGPWLPVYGVGGMMILLSMNKLKTRKIRIGQVNITPLLCLFSIILLCTAVELLTSYLMEFAMGSWLWDYTNEGPNFQGRIALKSSVRFGLIGMAVLYGVWPVLDKLFVSLKNKRPQVFGLISYLLIDLFLMDVIARFFVGGNYVGP